MNNCLWIPGWACHFSNEFKEHIQAMNPDMDHHWVSFTQTINHKELQIIIDDYKPSHIVAWSLGAKKLARCFINSKVLFIAPALDFCHEKLGVKQRVLSKMQKALKLKKEPVLISFLGNVGIRGGQLDSYMDSLKDVSIDVLDTGLEQLMKSSPMNEIAELGELDCTTVIGLQDEILNPQILPALNKEAQFTKLTVLDNLDHNAEHYLLDPIYEDWLNQ